MNEIKKGYVPNEVYKVEQFGNKFKLIDTAGVKDRRQSRSKYGAKASKT